MKTVSSILALTLVVGSAALLGSCGKNIPHAAEAKSESPITVQTAKVTIAPMVATLKVTGNLEGVREATVASETQGRVVSIARNTGDRVGQGAAIVRVDDELKAVAVKQAEANLMSAQAAYEKAKVDLDRTEQLVKDNAATRNQLELAQLQVKASLAGVKGAEASESLAKRQLADATVKAPIGGVVSMRYVNQGEMLTPGAKVVTIVDDSKMKLRMSVGEVDVPNLKVGQKVDVTIDALSRKVRGSVTAVSGKADQAHSYQVEVNIPNSGELKSGMFARAEIERQAPQDVPVVPNAALITTGSKTQVYVVNDGVAYLRAVKIGSSTADQVEVLDGLKEGDEIVTFGQNMLHDGAHVRK
jgi:RND family efflux transporter MFP subunit